MLPIVLCLLAGAAGAGDAGAPLIPAGTARVADVVDGDTLRLDDGRTLRLVGIMAPKSVLGDKARAALAGLVSGRTVDLRTGGRPRDRHGRVLAHVFVDGLWVQGEMLERGMARVQTLADNRSLATGMYAREQRARGRGLGVWGLSIHAVRAPSETGRWIGTFQVVEGTVAEATRAGGRIYLNFGSDWRNDFTVSIPPEAAALFRKEKINPLDWKGHPVRVRGWLDSLNGPMIVLSHPEQIEIGAAP
ncbi:MAG: thermonuclease family protein [Alphaproteobacteria bacterium]|nr:thermonuclease family protein [Alphaproteobacteria bacterium]